MKYKVVWFETDPNDEKVVEGDLRGITPTGYTYYKTTAYRDENQKFIYHKVLVDKSMIVEFESVGNAAKDRSQALKLAQPEWGNPPQRKLKATIRCEYCAGEMSSGAFGAERSCGNSECRLKRAAEKKRIFEAQVNYIAVVDGQVHKAHNLAALRHKVDSQSCLPLRSGDYVHRNT